MRLDTILDSFYLLSSLWNANPGGDVCFSRATPSAAVGHLLPVAKASAEITAFVDVNVVPMDTERLLLHQTVVVKSGRITALGPAANVKVPSGAVRVDGRGKYLMPGLADMHGHLFTGNRPEHEAERFLFKYLANGVTTLRELALVSDEKKSVYRRFKAPDFLGPRLYISASLGPSIWGAGPDSVRARVAAVYAGKEYEFLAFYGGHYTLFRDPRPFYDSLLATARRLNLPVSSHTNNEKFEEMLALGAVGGSIEHLDVFLSQTADTSEAGLRAIAEKTQRAGTWVTVTLVCDNYPRAQRLVKAMQDAGVKLLLGADTDGAGGKTWPNIVHVELTNMVRAGLTPYQALLTSTRNPAQHMKLLDSSGTVTVGKWADLVLLYSNPLENIRHTLEPAGVMIRGRWLDREKLDQADGLSASPKEWLYNEVLSDLKPRVTSADVFEHAAKAGILFDSLMLPSPIDGASLTQRLGEHFGAIRALLTPEQREMFDPRMRVWLREQTRKGRPTVITGVASLTGAKKLSHSSIDPYNPEDNLAKNHILKYINSK